MRGNRAQGLPGAADAVGAVVPTVGVLAITTVAQRFQDHANQLDVLGYGWLLLAGLPLLLARRYPIVVFVLSAAVTVAYYVSPYPGGPVAILPAFALFVLARLRGPIPAGISATAFVAVLLGVDLALGWAWGLDFRWAGLCAGLAAIVGIGTAVRNRGAATRAARDRAVEHQRRLAEQERLRIAREVHDVVAHSLAMINVQAGVASHVADRRPEQAREALDNIKQASASALKDLRATVAVLRSGTDRAPIAGLDQMPELIEHASATGLRVDVHGSAGDLPAPTDGAAYRILQEALTNVIRHANQPTAVEVYFGRKEGNLELVVRDNGVGTEEPIMGNGLRGMRERAEALGGSVSLGVAESRGFQVRAVLPIEGSRS